MCASFYVTLIKICFSNRVKKVQNSPLEEQGIFKADSVGLLEYVPVFMSEKISRL